MGKDIYFDTIEEINKKYKDGLYKEWELNRYIDNDSTPKKVINPQLPLFSYGFLKDGEIGNDVIYQYIKSPDYVKSSRVIRYSLYLKDGLPVALDDEAGTINGQLLEFNKGDAELAYRNISIMTMGEVYAWKEITDLHGHKANMLVLKKSVVDQDSTLLSLVKSENNEWHSAEDACFFDGMNFLLEHCFNHLLTDKKHGKKKMFDVKNNIEASIGLQMAYMYLWSLIDRYCSMCYWVDNRKVTDKARMLLTNNEKFDKAIKLFEGNFPSQKNDKIYRSYNGQPIEFSENKIIDYYYTIRCNVVHRGKGTDKRDVNILKHAFLELFAIMYGVIRYDFSLIEKVKNELPCI